MNTIDRDALLKWLDEQYYREDISHDRARAFLLIKRKIESGHFDSPSEPDGEWKAISEIVQRENEQLKAENERLRAALEQLIEDYERRLRSAITMIDDPNTPNEQRIRVHGKKEAYRTFIHELQSLSTTTEPTGAERVRECPDHPDEKPQISSSHTWTQDGNTYFVSYVEYCPTCYHVISTSARL